MAEKTEEEKKNTALATVSKEYLAKNQNLGMRGVEASDIRPPSILLMQGLSRLTEYVDGNGKNPVPGEYFHTGTMRIFKEFEAYFLWAGKGTYTDKRKPLEGAKDVYRAIGVVADDMSVFGMRFKSSTLYTLSSLFTAVTANKRGMYTIKVKMGTKSLENDKGVWVIPTLSIVAMEDDPGRLAELEKLARLYDTLGVTAAPKAESELEEDEDSREEEGKPVEGATTKNEDVKPEDIPF